MARRKRRKFTTEFKADAVRLCRSGGKSIPQVAKIAKRFLRLEEAIAERESQAARSCRRRKQCTRTAAGDTAAPLLAWDNAVSESFFATLRVELVDHEHYSTPAAAEVSIGDYIERFYNSERLHSHLDYVSPIEFELKEHIAATAA